MDTVFDALADPNRHPILDRLYASDGLTLSEICAELKMTRPGVSKHLSKLEEAQLIAIVWKGREKHHFLNVVPLQQIYSRWIRKFDSDRNDALLGLNARIEE
jgi:DNA-binding transcriptional ArsR family regulator